MREKNVDKTDSGTLVDYIKTGLDSGKTTSYETSGGSGAGGSNSVGETYYGDSSIVPTNQEYFTFTVNEDGKTATITGIKDNYAVKTYYHDNGTDVYNCAIIDNGTYITDIVIPYEYVEGENTYTVTRIGNLAFGPQGT